MFTSLGRVLEAAPTTQRPALRPSSTKSEPMKPTYSDGIGASTARSVRITGIFAALASCSTVSQPDSTTGENAMTSTFCAMKERIALIWFSCFCCASENRRSMLHGGRGRLDRFGVRGAPFALGADLAEAEHDAVVLFARRAAREQREAQRPRRPGFRTVSCVSSLPS